MKLNKDIFVNEEIKTKVPKLQRLMIILTVVAGIVLVAAFAAIAFPLRSRLGEDFMAAYAFAGFITGAVVIAFALIAPFDIKIRGLIARQAEELKDSPVYEKYITLMDLERERAANIILAAGILISLILTWVLAILYPNKTYATVGFVAPMFVFTVILLIMSYIKQKKLTRLETEIIKELS